MLSIIVPTCNRPAALHSCLAAIQTAVQCLPTGTCEVIVTFDGEQAGQADLGSGGIRFVRGPKRGPASNRNNGAAQATGEWLVFIDDDCVPAHDILAAYVHAIRPGVFVYEGKTTCSEGLRSALAYAPVNTDGGCLWSCNFMIQREAFRQIGGFDEGFPYAAMEDVDLRERLKSAAYEIRFVPAAVVDHPARKLSGLRELENHYVSAAYYTIRKRGKPLKTSSLLALALRTRLRRILTAPDQIDSAKAINLLIRELLMIVRRKHLWERRFQTPDSR